jgi:hypothetical protein
VEQSNTNQPNQEQLILDLTNSIQDTTAVVAKVVSLTTIHASEVASIKSQVKSLHENLNKLNRIITDGNGNSPLIVRISLLEDHIGDLTKYLEKAEERSRVEHKQRIKIYVALTIAILGILKDFVLMLI